MKASEAAKLFSEQQKKRDRKVEAYNRKGLAKAEDELEMQRDYAKRWHKEVVPQVIKTALAQWGNPGERPRRYFTVYSSSYAENDFKWPKWASMVVLNHGFVSELMRLLQHDGYPVSHRREEKFDDRPDRPEELLIDVEKLVNPGRFS